jgi:hypothetical protein
MKKRIILPALSLFMTSLTVSLSAQTLTGDWAFGAQDGTPITSGDATGFTYQVDVQSNSTATTYFAPGGTPVTLAEGETLQVTFNVTFNYQREGVGLNANDAFRFGLMNTGDSQTTGNNYSVSGNSGWTGYSIWAPSFAGGTNPTVTLRDRQGTNDIVMASSANPTISTLTYDNATNPLNNGTYAGELSVTRTATGVTISGSIGAYSFTDVVDDTNGVFSFDAIQFFAAGTPLGQAGDGGSFSVSDLSVAVIPEPETQALLIGLGILSIAYLRRIR